MIFLRGNDISIAITTRCLKIVGYWMAADGVERNGRDLMKVYTVMTVMVTTLVTVRDISHSLDNTSDMLYTLCNLVTLIMCLLKLSTILTHSTEFFNLIIYLQRKFLQSTYDLYEKAAVDTCKRKCSIYICCFTFFALATCTSYSFNALVDKSCTAYAISLSSTTVSVRDQLTSFLTLYKFETIDYSVTNANIGQNDSDRQLPVNMYIDIESVTPYFEIFFILQSMFLVQIGITYFCFDNILCIICLHASCQFRILQYRLRNLNKINGEENRNGNCSENYYAAFRNSVQYHQALIAFCNKLEEVFNLFALYQVVIFSLLICLDGYQIVMADAPLTRRLTFIFHIMGCMVQLLMFTYGCDCLMRDSADVASSMYEAPWLRLPMDKDGRMLRKDLLLVIARTRVPCYLTACRFSAISLETYTKVLSTAVSYFTLLRQHTEIIEDP